MLNKIWQFIKQLIQQLFGTKLSPTPVQQKPLPPTLTDAEYEAKFMELLEGVNQGWSRGDVAGFLIAKSLKNAELAAWLRRFGARLLETESGGDVAAVDAIESLQELAQRLLLLSRISDGNWEMLRGELAESYWQDFRCRLLRMMVGMEMLLRQYLLGMVWVL